MFLYKKKSRFFLNKEFGFFIIKKYFLIYQETFFDLSRNIFLNLLNYDYSYVFTTFSINGCRTIGLSDYRVVGLSGCRTIGLSDYRAVGILGLRNGARYEFMSVIVNFGKMKRLSFLW